MAVWVQVPLRVPKDLVTAGSLLLAMAVWVPIAIGIGPTPGTKQHGERVLSKRDARPTQNLAHHSAGSLSSGMHRTGPASLSSDTPSSEWASHPSGKVIGKGAGIASVETVR